MVDEKFRMECENMFGRNLGRIEALEKQMKLALENDDEQDDVLETHETVLRDYFKYRKDWSELIMKKSPYGSPLDTWMMISLHKFMKDALEKFDSNPGKNEPEKEFEFQLVEKFIPPRNIKCTDCMNNPVPKLIEAFLRDYRLKKENIKDYVRRSFYDCEENDALLQDNLFKDLEDKWEAMQKK